jgi:hypothetical protein
MEARASPPVQTETNVGQTLLSAASLPHCPLEKIVIPNEVRDTLLAQSHPSNRSPTQKYLRSPDTVERAFRPASEPKESGL